MKQFKPVTVLVVLTITGALGLTGCGRKDQVQDTAAAESAAPEDAMNSSTATGTAPSAAGQTTPDMPPTDRMAPDGTATGAAPPTDGTSGEPATQGATPPT